MTSFAKAAPMTRDETRMLVQLIATNSAIIIKATNAANNKIKDEAWQSLTSEFNSAVSSFARTTTQLRLKWENLKKSARKRCACIRSSLNKTGGGKDYFPPDEVLDQIATLLGNTCTGFTVEFGGDAVEIDSVLLAQNVENMSQDYVVVDRDGVIGGGGVGVSGDCISVGVSCEGSDSAQREVLKENIFQTPTSEKKSFYFGKASGSGSLAKRKFKLEKEITKARVQRENALTEYLLAKKKKN